MSDASPVSPPTAIKKTTENAACLANTKDMSGDTESLIAKELKGLRENIPEVYFTCCRQDLIHFRIGTTWARTIVVKMVAPSGYPYVAVALDASAPYLPEQLLDKLVSQAESEASTQVPNLHIESTIRQLLKWTDNSLLPVWQEIKDLKEVLHESETFRQSKSKGTVNINLKKGRYFCDVQARIPHNYPSEGAFLEIQNTNFHESLVTVYMAQAREMVQYLTLGLNFRDAIRRSLGQEVQKIEAKDTGPKVDLSARGLLDLRRDMYWLKERSAMREAASDTAKDRRLQRRHDLREWERELARLKDQEDAEEALQPSQAMPSLLAAVSYLMEEFVHALPDMKCYVCSSRLFPKNPDKQAALFIDSDTGKRKAHMPERTLCCAQWLHYRCFEKLMVEPDEHGSFKRMCQSCGRELEHRTLWRNRGAIEKKWLKEIERQREIADISDFMGF
eukprot:m.600850 g.600850  ORF g.600850 m.600850 type:complete len:448 (-) comp22435_c0_seq3:2181-3524(-)